MSKGTVRARAGRVVAGTCVAGLLAVSPAYANMEGFDAAYPKSHAYPQSVRAQAPVYGPPPDYYLVEELDFSDLVSELARAGKVEEASYTPESFVAVAQAVERGEQALALELPADATRQERAELQGQIDSAADDLRAALDGLVLAPPGPSIAQLAVAGVAALAIVGVACFAFPRKKPRADG